MKTFKTLDYIIQILLIAFAVFSTLIIGFDLDNGPAIPMYFAVGGWQVLSVLVHLFLRDAPKIRLRKIYHILLISTLGIGFLTMFGEALIYFLAILLFWSPVLAVMYVVCCYIETQKLTTAIVNTGQVD